VVLLPIVAVPVAVVLPVVALAAVVVLPIVALPPAAALPIVGVPVVGVPTVTPPTVPAPPLAVVPTPPEVAPELVLEGLAGSLQAARITPGKRERRKTAPRRILFGMGPFACC
jgi:hypothetical protein